MKSLLFCLFFLISGNALCSDKVLTTFNVIEDIVKEIVKGKLEVVNLVKAGQDPHLYEPSSEDLNLLKQASVIFANGLHFEPWLPKLLKTSETESRVIYVSRLTKPRQLMVDGNEELDPHAWNSPREVINFSKVITEELGKKYPENKDFFELNAATFVKKISMIDAKYKKAFSKIASKKRVMLTTHDAAGYIASDYNIKSLAPIGLSTTEEFRTKDLADLIGNIKKYDIKIIFSEKSHHQILSEKLANKAKLKLGKPLFLDGLSLQGEGASNVEDMLEYNLSQILGGMK